MSNTKIKYPAKAGNDLHPSTFLLGGERKINRLGYGTMQLTGPRVWGDALDRELAKSVLRTAVEEGVNFIDTADAYGPHTSAVSYTHLRAHETDSYLVCRLLLV